MNMKTYIKPIDNSVMNAGQKATDIYPTDLIEKKRNSRRFQQL